MAYKVFVIDGDVENKFDAIKLTAGKLQEEGCVKDSFCDACIEREKIYPTGIPSMVPIAIPHTEKDHVIEPAVCIMRLKSPIVFNNMENMNTELCVHYVFNLALIDGKDQIKMLQKVIGIVKDSFFYEKASSASLTELQNYLEGRVNGIY